jgi:hypothetical protein
MKHTDRSLPLAFVLAAAVQMPGTVLPDTSRALQPGVLSPLMERPAAAASGRQGDDRPESQQRTAQRFLNFGNCGGRSC